MKHIFIVNPCAGTGDMTDFIKKQLKELNLNIDYEVYRTTEKGGATRYIKEILSKNTGEYRFYSCGGDGTLNEVVNGAVGYSNASVTVLPYGSGNDFIKYYGKAEDFLNIKELTQAKNHKIDVLKACGRYAVNAVHFGFDTAVLKTMEKVRRKFLLGGKNAYTTGVVTALINGMKTACTVKADGNKIGKEKMLLCTLSNGKYVGGSYKCAPNSLNDDGLMEVCLVNTLSRLTLLRFISKYKEGTHLENKSMQKYINYTKAKTVEIEGGKGFCLSLDGELVFTEKCTVELVSGALNFAVPQKLCNSVSENKERQVI